MGGVLFSGFFLFALVQLPLSQEIEIPEMYLPKSKFLIIAFLRQCRVSSPLDHCSQTRERKKNVNRKEVECFELNAQYWFLVVNALKMKGKKKRKSKENFCQKEKRTREKESRERERMSAKEKFKKAKARSGQIKFMNEGERKENSSFFC